jgi:hypothetical protein
MTLIDAASWPASSSLFSRLRSASGYGWLAGNGPAHRMLTRVGSACASSISSAFRERDRFDADALVTFPGHEPVPLPFTSPTAEIQDPHRGPTGHFVFMQGSPDAA